MIEPHRHAGAHARIADRAARRDRVHAATRQRGAVKRFRRGQTLPIFFPREEIVAGRGDSRIADVAGESRPHPRRGVFDAAKDFVVHLRDIE